MAQAKSSPIPFALFHPVCTRKLYRIPHGSPSGESEMPQQTDFDSTALLALRDDETRA